MPVFSLSEVRSNQIKNYENTFEEQVVSNYGYYMGGKNINTGVNLSDVDRIDFSNDTVSFPHYHPQTLGTNVSAFQDSTNHYGYFIGGLARGGPGYVCAIDRMDFGNETWQPNTYLTAGSNGGANVFSSEYAYIQQSTTPVTNYDCDVVRISFSDSTGSIIPDIFPQITTGSRTVSSTSFGYFVGGNQPGLGTPPPSSSSSNVYKLNFSSETISASPTPSTYKASTGFSGHLSLNQGYGYIASGYEPVLFSTIERLDTSSDNIQALSAVISGGGSRSSNGCTQSRDNQYFALGWPPDRSTIDRFDYSTETNTTPGITLQRNKSHNDWNGFEGGTKITRGTPKYTNWNEYASYGYYGGGATPSRQQTLDRIDFNTETLNNQPNTILRDVGFFQVTESDAAGYYAGGNTGATGSTNCSKLEFLSETTSILSSYLNTARSNQAAVKSPEGAYISKGGSSNIEKLNFETETFGVSNVFGFDYNTHRGTQNKQYGYYAGGYYTSYIDKIDKHDFSTETIQENQTALNIKSGRQGATETEDYGYFIGGVNESITLSQVQRLDFSSDTVSIRPGGLNTARMDTDATNSISYGFFAGGHIPSPNILSTVERFDYDTETISNPGGVLSQARRAVGTVQGGSALRQVGKNNRNDSRAGLDNQGRNVGASYGYFAGGAPGAPTLTRIDYLNETTTEPSATITLSANGITCLSNVNYGYVTGGYGGSNLVPNISRIDRFDHSNETMKTSSNNLITPTGFLYYSAGNKNYGYVAGGYEQGVSSGYKLSVIQRLDYDTETVDQNNSRLLTGDITNGYAMSHNRNYIYYIGDFDSQTNTCRLDFSTEVITNINNNTDSFYRGVGANTETDGYLLGNLGGGYKSTIYKLDFSSETLSSISNKLSREITSVSGNQNTNYGYIGGGDTPTTPITTSYIDRFEFSTETASNPGNPMTRSRRQNAGFANLPAF